MSTIKKSKFLKLRNFEQLKTHNFVAAKFNGFTTSITTKRHQNNIMAIH